MKPRWERIKPTEAELSAGLLASNEAQADTPAETRVPEKHPTPGEQAQPWEQGSLGPETWWSAAPLEDPARLVVAVVGPTASGKSDLSLDLAQMLPAELGAPTAEVIGADALQLYRGMDIGTAKTPLEERRGIVHHQIDVLDIQDEASVASYQKYARQDLAQIHERGNVAVVAGGSGLYQRALLDVIEFPGTNKAVRARLEAECEGPLGSRGLHERLIRLDPVAASRIDPANGRRIIRALEVIEVTGRSYSASMPRHEFVLPTVAVAIQWENDALDERIALRTRMMFEAGLIEEVRALLDQGLREAKTASRATGYSQAIAVIDGTMSVEEAIESVRVATRQLARRQIKWLRPDPRTLWIPADMPGGVAKAAFEAIRRSLG